MHFLRGFYGKSGPEKESQRPFPHTLQQADMEEGNEIVLLKDFRSTLLNDILYFDIFKILIFQA